MPQTLKWKLQLFMQCISCLGHKAMSLNAILANRNSGEYSLRPEKTVENLIEYTLTRL